MTVSSHNVQGKIFRLKRGAQQVLRVPTGSPAVPVGWASEACCATSFSSTWDLRRWWGHSPSVRCGGTAHWMIDESLKKWAVQWVDRLGLRSGHPCTSPRDESGVRPHPGLRERLPRDRIRPVLPARRQPVASNSRPCPRTISSRQPTEFHGARIGLDSNVCVTETSPTRSIEASHGRPATSVRARPSGQSPSSRMVCSASIPRTSEAEARSLLGFIELGLDFHFYHETMMRRVMRWSVGILLGSVRVWRWRDCSDSGVRLRPLRNLREPLSRLAQGELEIPMKDYGWARRARRHQRCTGHDHQCTARAGSESLREAANFDQLTGLMGRFGLERGHQRWRSRESNEQAPRAARCSSSTSISSST